MFQLNASAVNLNNGRVKIINENFSQLAPSYYSLVTHWFINAYKNFKGIDKYIILIYLINKDFIHYRKNGLMVDYDTFYKDKTLEIPNINISDIARDLLIPKENVRRKISELEEKGIIKRKGKKIFIERSGFIQSKTNVTLNDFSILVSKFSEVLKDKNIVDKSFDAEEIIINNDGEAVYYPLVFNTVEAQKLLSELLSNIEWQHDEVIMFGKQITTKRKVAWYAGEGISYTYAGKRKDPLPWSPLLLSIKDIVEKQTGATYNACLLNLFTAISDSNRDCIK